MDLYRDFFKIFIDKLVALLVLIVFSPIFILLSILLAIQFKGKPFYAQPRIGYKNKIFRIIKFRKMTDETDENGNLLPEDQRMTRLGRFIRRSSLDELPQFINVLLGQMSLIGPRPLLAGYLPYYTPRELRRHLVRPGITGWAQVNGRTALDWNTRFEYDVEYVENLSFWFDVKIIFLTIKTVFNTFFYSNKPDTVKLPRLYEYRAFIRLAQENEMDKIKDLFDLKEDKLADCQGDILIFVDDYKGTYNSYFRVCVEKRNARIMDYFIGRNTFLPGNQMYSRYLEIIKKYLLDLGYLQDLKL